MSDDRAVGVLDQRVNDAFSMDDDLDLGCGDVEEPVRLDHFQPFIHQRGGVNRDLRPHFPVRMLECLLRLNSPHLLRGQIP